MKVGEIWKHKEHKGKIDTEELRIFTGDDSLKENGAALVQITDIKYESYNFPTAEIKDDKLNFYEDVGKDYVVTFRWIELVYACDSVPRKIFLEDFEFVRDSL